MPYAKTSLRAEQRAVREQMRALGFSRRQVAVEFARRYRFRPRPAWRHAWGWSLTEAAARISSYAARAGLDPDGKTVAMTAPHLSEYENWPGPGLKPAGRLPTPYLLSLLAAVYECAVHDLLDLADYEHMPAADQLVVDNTKPKARGEPSWAPRPATVMPRSRGTPAASACAAAVCGLPGSRPAYPVNAGYGPHPDEANLAGRTIDGRADWLSGQRDDRAEFGQKVSANWPGTCLSVPVPDQGVDWQVRFPAGRGLDMAGTVTVQVHPLVTAADGSGYLPVAGGSRLEQVVATPHRAMLVGVDERPQGISRLFGADLRDAHRKITQSQGVPSAIAIPGAYELDDITYGIIWALISLDDALLVDDGALDQRQREVREYERLPQSAADRQAAAGLTAAARMWLGSSFCARHILRNLASPPGLPVFWTREQTGEEACTWLLFRHKHGYLRHIGGQFADASDPLVRGFCVPEAAVAMSPRWERILLFLSVALMESFGIHVKICTEPGYADIDGFVLLPGSRAIIATWVRAEGVWHADSVTRGPAVRGFADVTGHASAHSVSEAATPGGRLMALAAYLGLDWPWLWRRCADLGEHGLAGLVQPRSRLLSTGAADRALRFAGRLGRQAAMR